MDGTAGQGAAGVQMTGGGFTQIGGFWQPPTLAPTAASVTVSGRVMTQNGRSIRLATVVITDFRGNRRYTSTNTFGYFRLVDIEAGQSYLIEVIARAYTFEPRLVSVEEEITGLAFTALP